MFFHWCNQIFPLSHFSAYYIDLALCMDKKKKKKSIQIHTLYCECNVLGLCSLPPPPQMKTTSAPWLLADVNIVNYRVTAILTLFCSNFFLIGAGKREGYNNYFPLGMHYLLCIFKGHLRWILASNKFIVEVITVGSFFFLEFIYASSWFEFTPGSDLWHSR